MFDPGLSEVLWSDPEFAWITPLVDVRPLPDVTDADVRAAAGFTRVQMSMPVRSGALQAVHTLIASGPPPTLSTEIPSGLAEIDPDAPLSVWAIAERRNEQSLLRRALIPAATGQCDLCGDLFPAAFLRVAHVKQRARCTDSEKRDHKNLLVACVRCDIAFERGWLGLDDEQRVMLSATLPTTAVISAQLGELVGRPVARELNPDSVAYHRSNTFVP
jgi:hypothetical protein